MPTIAREYLGKFQLTADVANALYHLLQDMEIPIEGVVDPAEVLDTVYGHVVMDAFVQTSRFTDSDVSPRLPEIFEPGYPEGLPVIFNVEAARRLRALLLEARKNRESLSANGGIEGFSESIRVFFDQRINGDAAERMTNGARRLLPLALDWTDKEGAGEFAGYLSLPHFVVTHHTQQQIQASQIMAAIMRLGPEDAGEQLAHDIRVAKTILGEIIADLGVYFFDQYAITRLHTERIQNGLFDKTRQHRVYVARLAINISDMNDLDHTEEFGTFVLDVMKKWLQNQKGRMRSAVQSAERTTFQFIVEEPADAIGIFRNFERDFADAMDLEFSARYPDRRNLSEDAENLLRNINKFKVRGTVAVLPFDSKNVVDFAVQEASDVEVFFDILSLTDIPRRTLEDARRRKFDEAGFLALKPWLEKISLDMDRTKAWVNDQFLDDKTRASRKQLFQAFILQGIYYNLKYLSGVLDYFEKEKASDEPVAVYTAKDVPTRDGDFGEHAKLMAYLERDKYVSDGTFNPAIEYPELLERPFVEHLPHLRVLHERVGERDGPKLSPRVAKVLKVWDRMSHEWGHLTHAPRKGNPGGTKEVMFTALGALADAVENGDKKKAADALAKVKECVPRFARSIREIWARALADPKNPFFFKRDVIGVTHWGQPVNAAVFRQELARLGWVDAFGAEADSIKKFLATHSMLFSPDFDDAAFQSVWSIVLRVQREWEMPVPLIYRPGGDFVMIVTPPKDIHGNPVDPVAFEHEVWARVKSEYDGMPFHDVKKVTMRETQLTLDGSYEHAQMEDALLIVADELGLQTVPFLLPKKEGGYVLYSPATNGWRNDEEVNPESVIDALRKNGISIAQYRLTDSTSLKRIGIFMQRDGEQGPRYRFSNFTLGENWREFYKKLTLSTMAGELTPIVDRAAAANFTDFQMDMGRGVQGVKDANFPDKAGFGIHRTRVITAQDVGSRLDWYWDHFRTLAEYADNNTLRHIHDELPESLGEDPAGAFNIVHGLALRANSVWFSKLSMIVSRLNAANEAIRKIMSASPDTTRGELRGEFETLIDRRHVASEILKSIKTGLEIMKNLMKKYSGTKWDGETAEFEEGDMMSATVAIELIKQKISAFRNLSRGRGGGSPGGAVSGGSGGANETPTQSFGDSGEAGPAQHVGAAAYAGYVTTTGTRIAGETAISRLPEQLYSGGRLCSGVTAGLPFSMSAPLPFSPTVSTSAFFGNMPAVNIGLR